jgi:hypothetical protein
LKGIVTNSKKLAASVQAVAEQLKIAAVWNGSRESVDGAKDNYVYEILCYLHIAKAAKSGFNLQIGGRTERLRDGTSVARWPKKPGKKLNFSYFRLFEKSQPAESFQLCPGVKIADKHGKYRAPDVNLLSGGALDPPDYGQLQACWDAKYSIKPGVPVPDVAVSDFGYTF